MVALAAAEAILAAGSEVAPANQVVEGPAEALLYEAPLTLVGMAARGTAAHANPRSVVRVTRETENWLGDIFSDEKYVQREDQDMKLS